MSTFRVKGQLSLDGSRFAAGLTRAETAAARFSRSMTSMIGGRLAGLFAVGAMGAFARNMLRTNDALVAQAKRLGVSVEMTQVLGRAADDAGGKLEGLTNALETLGQYQQQALSGRRGKRYRELFAAMGIDEEQLRTMRPSELFLGPMRDFARRSSQEQAGSLMRQLMSSQGSIMTQILKSDLEGLRDDMATLGAIISDETSAKLKHLNDYLEIAGKSLTAAFAPAVLGAAQALVGWGLAIAKHTSTTLAGIAGAGGKMTAGQQIGAWAKVASGQIFTYAARAVGAITKEEADDFMEYVAQRAGLNTEAAGFAMMQTEESWNKVIKQLESVSAILAGLGEGAAPLPTTPETAAGKQPRIAGPYSDALLAVGNFLGAGRASSVDRIATQQLRVQEQIRDGVNALRESDAGFGGMD